VRVVAAAQVSAPVAYKLNFNQVSSSSDTESKREPTSQNEVNVLMLSRQVGRLHNLVFLADGDLSADRFRSKAAAASGCYQEWIVLHLGPPS
jgi:hypothetical protein